MHNLLKTTSETYQGKLLYLQKRQRKRMDFLSPQLPTWGLQFHAIRALDWTDFSNQASQISTINSLDHK